MRCQRSMISVITLCLLAGCNQEELPQATIEGPDAATVREITKFKFSTDGDAVDRLIVFWERGICASFAIADRVSRLPIPPLPLPSL